MIVSGLYHENQAWGEQLSSELKTIWIILAEADLVPESFR